MKRTLFIAIASVVATLVVAGWWHSKARDAWEVRADSAVAQALLARAEADSLRAVADSAIAVATAHADTATAATPAPERLDTLRQFVLRTDSSLVGVVDSLTRSRDHWKLAYDNLMAANASLTLANERLADSNAKLRTTLAARPKPPLAIDLGILRLELLPTIGPGLFVGWCDDGRLCKGGGLTLTWNARPG